MKNDLRYFWRELQNHYSLKFFGAFLLLVIVILSPLLMIVNKVKFSPVDFANIYISTVFTSILIGFILQIIDLYKSSLVNYSNVNKLLKALLSILNSLKSTLKENNVSLRGYGELLEHYHTSILDSLIADEKINEKMVLLYRHPDFEYIIQSLKISDSLHVAKKNEVSKKIDTLIESLHQILTIL